MLLRTTKILFGKPNFAVLNKSLYSPFQSIIYRFSTTPEDPSISQDEAKKKRKKRKSNKHLNEIEEGLSDPSETIEETKFEEKFEKIWERPNIEKNILEENPEPAPKPGVFMRSKKKKNGAEKPEKSEKSEKSEKNETKSSVFIKPEPATNKVREMAELQNLRDIVNFIEKPQNKILMISEKQILYEKIVKLISLQNIDSRSPYLPPIKTFLEGFKVSLRGGDDIRYYISVFSLSINKMMAVAFEEFYTDCVEEMLKSPKFKASDLIYILPNLYRYYYSLDIQPRHQEQVTKLLVLLEDKLDKLSIQNKLNLLTLMRAAKTYNDKILDFMLYYADVNFDMLGYEDTLNIILTVLAAKKVNPFELLYRLRIKFNESYKELRPFVILRTLSVYTKMRMLFMEQLFENIFRVIGDDKVVKEFNHIDSVLIINYLNKSKYKDSSIFEKYLKKVMDNIKMLNEVHLKTLLLTLADMNYPNIEIYLQIYKHFNLITVIDDIQKEEVLTEFEIKYFKTICDYIIDNSKQPSTPEIVQ